MEDTYRPDVDLARKVLPGFLFDALLRIFEPGVPGCVLVGGTALSGFYAGHRRSDDLDLYTPDGQSFKIASLAVRQLAHHGVEIHDQQSTALYYRTVCRTGAASFTVDVVQDPAFFQVGKWHSTKEGIRVACLSTLLMCKAATLVSRASEKDLYDLIWLFDRFPALGPADLISLGQKIDGGLSAESILVSLSGAVLSEDACDFALDPGLSKKQIFARIQSLRKQLIEVLKDLGKVNPPPGLSEIVRRIKKVK